MKIKCLTENIKADHHNEKLIEWAKNTELEITEGNIYVVLAISKYFDVYFYYILGDESTTYPLAFPAELFEIIDSRVSQCWDLELRNIESLSKLNIRNNEVISFKEWSNENDFFYEKLLDKNAKEVSIFESYKNKMLQEFIE
ncbi:hypothetical protein [Chitinophaga sp.]|uniref:hypothetical protein n=1 Tax=Chitinophaga sp. TaxID=1869181 RepID=UPI002F922699